MVSETLLDKIGSDELMALAGMLVGVVAILGGIAVAITLVITNGRRRAQLAEMEATLKMEMIQHGMSADDIRKVLEARMGAGKGMSVHELLKPPPAPNFGRPENART
jgi:hypothetical protein